MPDCTGQASYNQASSDEIREQAEQQDDASENAGAARFDQLSSSPMWVSHCAMSSSMGTYYAKTHPGVVNYRGYPALAWSVKRVTGCPLVPCRDTSGIAG
jgi:hypothetical protein